MEQTNTQWYNETKKACPLKSGVRQKCLLSPLLFNISVTSWLEKYDERNERNKQKQADLHMFTDKMILYIKALMTPLQHS